jgi:hypothetical protein
MEGAMRGFADPKFERGNVLITLDPMAEKKVRT